MTKTRASLQATMQADAAVLRSAASLERAADTVERVQAEVHHLGVPVGAEAAGAADVSGSRREADPTAPAIGFGRAAVELANLATVARALCASARARTESRGAHARDDHPDLDPHQRVRYVIGGPDHPGP